jgi:SAM-dependent methyltransferase
MNDDRYRTRPLAALYPDLEQLGAAYHASHHGEGVQYTRLVVDCLERLVHLGGRPGCAVVLGCGPKPVAVPALVDRGFQVVAVEPVPAIVESARTFCGGMASVVQGSGEAMPLESGSQRFVLMESVLEHVDSVPRCLAEVFRVLAPGGVTYIYTTNRHKFSWRGFNGEYRLPFFNWFPRLLRECYVHHQLHFRPELANYNPRPAVHWFTFSELCARGRDAGFAHFYSLLDLASTDSLWATYSTVRKRVLPVVRRSPLLRALALTQAGGSVFMVKREQ